jgi:hypothetical protein
VTSKGTFRGGRSLFVALVIGLAMIVGGAVTLGSDRILNSEPARMPTLPVFDFQQHAGRVVRAIPNDQLLVLVSSAAVVVGLALVAIALVLRARSRPTAQETH